MSGPRVPEEVVIDANVFVDALIHHSEYRSSQPERASQHGAAIPYIEGLRSGRYRCHVPQVCVIETCATVRRVVWRNPIGRAQVVKEDFRRWRRDGVVVLHGIDDEFAVRAIGAAIRYSLHGADSTSVAVAETLSVPLKTRDKDILQRYLGASPP